METAPLKSFAIWARTSLIREVNARIAAVLAPASPERVERPGAVAALERAVTEAGGGATGRAAVADKVAYTWFNRILALRFMDANGYTGIGVVSPSHGSAVGQPEILAEAKRGNIDSDVVGRQTRDTVTGLLNGTRRSDDAQGEAYALLLAEYCRYWNRAMPFMFEREGDYTELLIPADLLAHDSVLARSVAVLTPGVCKDVEVIGWLYQFYISERKDEVFAGFKKNKKAGAAEIPAATQLFTPHWIVRYLVENSLGRLWLLNRPSSKLAELMDYYISPVDEQADFLRVSNPEELKICDPACGSGHMLTYAFDLLYAIYEEEGYAPSDIPGLILAHNLYGIEIDPRAGALAAFALSMKARGRQRTFFSRQIEPNICVLEPISFTLIELDRLVTYDGDRQEEGAFWNQFRHADIFGSLIRPRAELIEPLTRHVDKRESDKDGDLIWSELRQRAHTVLSQARYLAPKYQVVVMNPPYMGRRNMNRQLAEYLDSKFGSAGGDLFSAFVCGGHEMLLDGGGLAFLAPVAWLYIGRFESIRRLMVFSSPISTLVELPNIDFEGASVAVAATVFWRHGRTSTSCFLRLSGALKRQLPERLSSICKDPEDPDFFVGRMVDFKGVPGNVLAYSLPEAIRAGFQSYPPFGTVGKPRVGMQTGENSRYLRYWWEVSRAEITSPSSEHPKWVGYLKGLGHQPWYGTYLEVLNWPLYLREAPTRSTSTMMPQGAAIRAKCAWSSVSRNFSARLVQEEVYHDIGSHCAYPPPGSEFWILSFMNSTYFTEVVSLLNPTVNFQVSDIAQVPLPDVDRRELGRLGQEAFEIVKTSWDSTETSWGFGTNPLIRMQLSSADAAANRVRSQANKDEEQLLSITGVVDLEVWKALGLPAATPDRTSPRSSLHLLAPEAQGLAVDLVSYAVGCMFGRYSLEKPGLILADQGAPLEDYLADVPTPTFLPDKDNVIPIVEGDWFEDDIVARFRQFLRASFGEQNFEENLRFVTESLGVKDIRDYFVKSFYKDHLQRYKKRPIYWLFSSPKGSFNALIYMHRYTPTTVSTVLNEYLREYKAKLDASRQHHERIAAGAATPRERAAGQKEADRLRNVLLELDGYEHDVLYPLATRQIRIDLDDGVKANYPKFGAALKKIPGLEAGDE